MGVWKQRDPETKEFRRLSGSGKAGANGGHYTPTVSDNGDGTVTFGWSPSLAEMPKVEDQKVELPAGPVGVTPKFTVGTVITGEAGTDAAVSITGSDAEPVLRFVIPQGPDGYSPEITLSRYEATEDAPGGLTVSVKHKDGSVTSQKVSDGSDANVTAANINSALGYAPVNAQKLSLGYHTDGLVYIFVGDTPVGSGIEIGAGGDVIGYVDSGNNIVVKGSLANGTYTVKYEMEDGSTIDIGELVLDANVYCSVSSKLTNCVNSNSATQVIEGESYSAQISANGGYELSSVIVNMGGMDVSASVVSGGTINIASVTGDIVITAVADWASVSIKNWIEEVGYTADTRLSLSSGNEVVATDYECTGFIPAKIGDVLRVKNVDLTSENSTNIVFYSSSKDPVACNGTIYGTSLANFFTTSEGNGVNKGSIENTSILTFPADVAYIRIGSKSITDDSILTVNEEII